MNSTERNDVIDKHNIWKRLFYKLTSGFTTVISFVFQNPFSSGTWVVKNKEKQSLADELKDDNFNHNNNEPKKSGIELDIGYQLLSCQTMQIQIRVTEHEPPVGYLKILQCLRRQPSQMN